MIPILVLCVWDENIMACAGVIQFSGHYQDLGISSQKRDDSGMLIEAHHDRQPKGETLKKTDVYLLFRM